MTPPSPVGKAKAESRAYGLLRDHGIDYAPVPLEKIAQLEGMAVVYEALPNDTCSVLVRRPDSSRVIGVNSRHASTRQRFSLAHEIGHAVLHFNSDPPSEGDAVVDRLPEVMFRDGLASEGTNRLEIEANTFAANLLMPKHLVETRFRVQLQRNPSRSSSRIIDDLAAEFDVSPQAMGYRLVNLGHIDPT